MVDTPSLDYYIGQQVVEVMQGDEAWDWGLQLESGVVIQNEDKRRTHAPSVKNLVLASVSLSETDTTLNFGHSAGGQMVIDDQVTMTPTQHSIADDRFEGGPHYPQRATKEEEDLLPDDPSADRVADGPEEPLNGAESDGDATE